MDENVPRRCFLLFFGLKTHKLREILTKRQTFFVFLHRVNEQLKILINKKKHKKLDNITHKEAHIQSQKKFQNFKNFKKKNFKKKISKNQKNFKFLKNFKKNFKKNF